MSSLPERSIRLSTRLSTIISKQTFTSQSNKHNTNNTNNNNNNNTNTSSNNLSRTTSAPTFTQHVQSTQQKKLIHKTTVNDRVVNVICLLTCLFLLLVLIAVNSSFAFRRLPAIISC